jgi:hypothetical protein
VRRACSSAGDARGGRLADVFGARLVPIFLVFFGAVEWLPGIAHSVSTLVLFLAVVGIGTGLLDIAINAHAARLEALHGIRIMDGLHAAFSAGVLVGGIGSGLLRHAGAHPAWILAAVGVATALTALGNLGPYPPLAPPQRRERPARPLLIVGFVLALAFLVENGLEAWSALFLERTLDSGPAVSGLGPGLFAGAMLTGRVVAQKVEWPSVAGRMVVAGLASAAGLALAATADHAVVALAGFLIAGGGLALSAPTLFGLAGRVGGEGGRGAAPLDGGDHRLSGLRGRPRPHRGRFRASSLRGGFLFLCAVAVTLAACAPILRRVVREIGG